MTSGKPKKITSRRNIEIIVNSCYLDEEIFRGSLPDIFQKALSYIMGHLLKLQGNKSVNSIGDPEVPRLVFEELLVNALIHRNYFIGAPTRVFVFDDRIEIINPGNFPDHLTLEKICAKNSIPRNPALTPIVKALLPNRGSGRGIKRALKAWSQIKFIDDRKARLFTAVIQRPDLTLLR